MKKPKPFKAIKKNFASRRKPPINEVVREPTAGGVIWRRNNNKIEILLIQDSKDRWTIPKGHIEDGETAKQTAAREINEETGLKKVQIQDYLGRIKFQYRRQQSLVLMTTDIFLVQAQGDTDDTQAEKWMNGIGWFDAIDAVDKIEYSDISKLLLIGLKKIRQRG